MGLRAWRRHLGHCLRTSIVALYFLLIGTLVAIAVDEVLGIAVLSMRSIVVWLVGNAVLQGGLWALWLMT